MGARPLSVEFPDGRGGGRHLRLSWHAEQRQAVLSQWRGGVCVASTPLSLEELPRLGAFVTDALYQAAEHTGPGGPPTVASLAHDSRSIAQGAWRRWWGRRRPAPVIPIRDRQD